MDKKEAAKTAANALRTSLYALLQFLVIVLRFASAFLEMGAGATKPKSK